MDMIKFANNLLNPFNVKPSDQYIPDTTERYPEDEEEEKECECGCGKKEGCCTVDDEVDERLSEKYDDL